jgi:ABC-type transport system involved in Fe-S cluster assembly fused permease/ATPase subunit
VEHSDEHERQHEPHHYSHGRHSTPASNYHVYLSFALSALVTVIGFAATWGRTEQWRTQVDDRLKATEVRADAAAAQLATHEATIRVIDAQYQSIGKQLDRVEKSVDRIAEKN